MEEQALKTTWKQRLVIALIAIIMLGSTIAVYIFIALGKDVDYSKMTTNQLQTAYEETYEKYEERVSSLSSEYFDEFVAYKQNVKGYNSTTANSNGVTSTDLKEGTGDEIGDDYSAYYIGWCADETIFDSSFDNYETPTALEAPLSVTPDSLIEGWYLGTSGMRYGGIREVTIPGSLAYGDTQEICGSKNAPLKFIILAIKQDKDLEVLSEKLSNIYTALSSAFASEYSNYSDESVVEGEDGETVTVSE